MKFSKIHLFVFSVLAFPSFIYGQDKKELPEKIDSIEEFKETRHIALDKIYIPKELKIIEDEISQNTIDVIILSGTHNLVFNISFSNEGVLKTYKNFYSLKIDITPHPSSDGHFILNLFYYNWITKKEDHRLISKISKYNVLNELRMNLYRLFKGKQFVENRKEELEKSNYERIQAVAKSIEDKKRRKKIKEKAETKKNQEKDSSELTKKKDKQEYLKREEDPSKTVSQKNDTKNSTTKNSTKLTDETNTLNIDSNDSQNIIPLNEDDEVQRESSKNKKKSEKKSPSPDEPSQEIIPGDDKISEVPDGSEPAIPRKSKFHFFGGYHFENTATTATLTTKTNPKFVIAGANYENVQDKEKPHGFILGMKAGIPIISGGYQVPVYREIQSEFFYKDLIPNLSIGIGVDISPIYFVNLPGLAQGLQVFENDIYWAKFGLRYSYFIYDKMQSVAIYTYKDVVFKSNFEKKMSASKMKIFATGKVTEKFGYTIEHFSAIINGQITGTLKGYSLAMNYYFGD